MQQQKWEALSSGMLSLKFLIFWRVLERKIDFGELIDASSKMPDPQVSNLRAFWV